MKMRLTISYKSNYDKNGTLSSIHRLLNIENEILMKYILYVVIDDKKYTKPISDSKEIQKFYGFIQKNKFKIKEIMSSDGKHYFLKNGEYHSYNDYCYYRPGICKIYAINGNILNKEQERSFKINIIKNKLKSN